MPCTYYYTHFRCSAQNGGKTTNTLYIHQKGHLMYTIRLYKISVYSHLNPARFGWNWWTAVTERNGIWATAGSEWQQSKTFTATRSGRFWTARWNASANLVDGAYAPNSGSSSNCLECCSEPEVSWKKAWRAGGMEKYTQKSSGDILVNCICSAWLNDLKCTPNLGASVKLETLGDIEHLIFGRKFSLRTGNVKQFRESIISVHRRWQMRQEESKEVKTGRPLEVPHEYLPNWLR